MAYVLDKEKQRRKFDSKSVKGIFIGYANNNTYRVYVLEIGKVKADCDVKFDETRNGYELINKKGDKKQKNEEKLIIVGLNPENNEEWMEDRMEIEEYEEDELRAVFTKMSYRKISKTLYRKI